MKHWTARHKVFGMLRKGGGCLALCILILLQSAGIQAGTASSWPDLGPSLEQRTVPQPQLKQSKARTHTQGQLNVQRLIDLALQAHPSVQASWAQTMTAADSVGMALAAYYPQVSSDLYLRQTDQGWGRFRDFVKEDAQKEWGASLGIGYLLLDMGGRRHTVQAAHKSLDSANHHYNQTVLDMVLKVQQSYYQYVQALGMLKAKKKDLKAAQLSLDKATSFFQTGQRPKAAQFQAQAQTQVSQVKYELAQARSNARQAWRALATLCRLPKSPRRQVAQPAPLDTDLVSKSVQELLRIVDKRNPQMQALQAQMQASQHQVQATESAFWPTLNIKGQASVTDYSVDPSEIDGSIALMLKYDLFTGFSNTYSKHKAKSRLRVLRYKLAEQQLAFQEKVEKAMSQYQAAVDKVKAHKAYLQYAKKSQDQATEFFNQGLGTMLHVTKALDNVAKARGEVISSRMDMYMAAASLAHSCGDFDQLGAKRATWKPMGER